LKTDGGINELYLQWVPCIPGTTTQGVLVPKLELAARRPIPSASWVFYYQIVMIISVRKVTGIS